MSEGISDDTLKFTLISSHIKQTACEFVLINLDSYFKKCNT